MLSKLFYTALLSLAVSLPVEPEDVAALAPRDAQLTPRSSTGVSYTNAQNFQVISAGPPFSGPFSPNDIYFFMQNDGNFVAYTGDVDPRTPVWASNTAGDPSICDGTGQCWLSFQGDGNLVVVVGGHAIWSTGTGGKGYLVSFNGQEPYVVVYNRQNQAIWKSSNARITRPPPDPTCYRGVCP